MTRRDNFDREPTGAMPAGWLSGVTGDNYYVARGNALEDNVSLYYTARGKRNTIKYVDAPVPANVWHTLRVEFSGKRIKVQPDGKTYIE